MNENNEFPTFSLDDNGRIVSDMPETYGTVSGGDALSGYDFSESSSAPGDQDADQIVDQDHLQHDLLSSPLLMDIQEDIARIVNAQASTVGYLSSSALDTFDRVVSGFGYDYYCAFRTDSDSYNATMYLADKCRDSGNSFVLEDSLMVRLYRTYNNSAREYQYHYSVTSVGDVSISLGSNLMYYTNCREGYPILGNTSAPGHYPDSSLVLILMGLIVVFLLIRSWFRR